MNTCPMCGSSHIHKRTLSKQIKQGLPLDRLDDDIAEVTRSAKKSALVHVSEIILQGLMGSRTGNKESDKCSKALTSFLTETHYYCEDCHAAFYGNVLVDEDKEMTV